MIGHLIRECEHGRRDARIGVRDHYRGFPESDRRTAYFDGWKRERLAMMERGELPQLELALQFDPEVGAESP